MKRIFLLTVVCLIYASDVWARGCEVILSNAPGDIVYSYTDWWDQGEDGFTVYTYIDGYQVLPNDEYGIDRLPADYPCTGYCWPMQFVAKNWNVHIYNQLVNGNWSGWKCSQEAAVVGHWEAPPEPRLDLVAISPEMKDRAKLFSYGLYNGTLYLEPLIYLYGLLCAGSGDLDACTYALVLAAARRGLEIGKNWSDKFVLDPWDEQYGIPYDPQFYDPVSLGAPDCNGQDFCAYFNAHTMYIYGFWEAAYVSANRAASCAYVGNEDCFWWQKARMEYFVWAAGVHTGYLGDGLSIITNILGSQETSDAAAEVHYVGQLMVAQ